MQKTREIIFHATKIFKKTMKLLTMIIDDPHVEDFHKDEKDEDEEVVTTTAQNQSSVWSD